MKMNCETMAEMRQCDRGGDWSKYVRIQNEPVVHAVWILALVTNKTGKLAADTADQKNRAST